MTWHCHSDPVEPFLLGTFLAVGLFFSPSDSANGMPVEQSADCSLFLG